MKKGNVLAVLLATVGIMLFGTLAVSADAHAGIQSASGKSSVQPRLQRMSPAQPPPQKQVWGSPEKRKLPQMQWRIPVCTR